MRSNRASGAYYEMRSRKYLEKMGYKCERARAQFIPGTFRAVRYDFFNCADLIAVKKDSVVFVQVKLNKKNVAEARKKLEALPAPYGSKWIHVWTKGAHNPEVEIVM